MITILFIITYCLSIEAMLISAVAGNIAFFGSVIGIIASVWN